jgi:hypothetical protein
MSVVEAPAQPVDATQALNLSAGVSNCKERLAQLAAELVQAKPDVLVAGFGTLTAKAVAAATKNIPVVFTSVGDPVSSGLVESLGRRTYVIWTESAADKPTRCGVCR